MIPALAMIVFGELALAELEPAPGAARVADTTATLADTAADANDDDADPEHDPLLAHTGTIADIVVTGSRTPHPLADVPVATEVITRAEIEAAGAENAARALEAHLGVEIDRTFRGSTIRIQGLDADYVLILVDGQRTTGHLGNAIDLARFPAERIERIEIVKGASSALYGSDAIGGVVNIITRRAQSAFEADAHARYGARNALDLSSNAGLTEGPFNVELALGWHRADAYDLDPSEPSTSGSENESWSASTRAELTIDPDLTVFLSSEYLRQNTGGVDANSSGAVFDRRDVIETFAITAGPSFQFGEDTKIRATAHFALFRDQYLQDQRHASALDQYQETKERIAQLELQADHTLDDGKHLASAGLELSNEHLETPRIANGSGDRRRLAFYAQDEWTPLASPRVVFVPGVRVDIDSQFGSHTTPKLAARMDLGEVIVRASYGLGFRAPSFRDLYLRFENPSAGYVVNGNPALAPERSTGASAGLELRPTRVWWASISVFRHDIRDLIATTSLPSTPGAPTIFSYENVSSAHTQGVEASMRWKPIAGLTVDLGYTFTDSEDDSTGLPLVGRARHRGTFGARYDNFTIDGSASIRASIVGPRPFEVTNNSGGTDRVDAVAYASIDARVAKYFDRYLTLFFGADNLLDAHDAQFLPLPPRAFYAGVDARY